MGLGKREPEVFHEKSVTFYDEGSGRMEQKAVLDNGKFDTNDADGGRWLGKWEAFEDMEDTEPEGEMS